VNVAPLRVLVGCETTGEVRRAFAALGHDAWSVDVEPAEDRSNKHIVGDVRDWLAAGWDLVVICHPPCTRLCNSGVRWLTEPPPKAPKDARPEERAAWRLMSPEERLRIMWRLLDEGCDLFAACWHAPVERVCIENPVMHKHAWARMPRDLPRPQIVQPWWFGDPAFKGTCLWTRGLPRLLADRPLVPPKPGTPEHREWSTIHRMSPSPDRGRKRSRTFPGLARAMAAQWGGNGAAPAIAAAGGGR
jgi:hypothetical protein